MLNIRKVFHPNFFFVRSWIFCNSDTIKLIRLTVYLIFFQAEIGYDTVRRSLALGKLVGRYEKTVIEVPFYSFMGIPFAEPPVNDLRFEVSH